MMDRMSTTQLYPPTAEQQAAIDLFLTGQDLVIEAGAGTGKTATLVFIAEAAQQQGKRGQFLAFNKGIVEDCKGRFPISCDVRTVHSLAFRNIMGSRPGLKARLNSKRLSRTVEARILDVHDLNLRVTIGDVTQDKRLSADFLVAHVMRGIDRYCQSDSAEIEPWHFPTIEGIDEIDDLGNHRGDNNRRIAAQMVSVMQRAWTDLVSDDGRLRFTHAVYLKLWERSSPVVGTDYIVLDEAQDLSPCIQSVVMQQQGRSQLVFVGDQNQSIYGFTGAVDAMAQLVGPRTYLTKSFRFGPTIAAAANRILDRIPGAELRLVGHDPIPSKLEALTEPDAVLCRTNAKAIGVALAAMADGKRVAIADSLKKNVVGFAKAAIDLQRFGSTDHPELAPFSSWEAVQQFIADDPAGGDLKLLVDLVDAFGAEFIIVKLADTVTEARADLVVSTAHTSKGREWNGVQLADDFVRETRDLSPEELRLLYVAVTRAKIILDAVSVPMVLGGGAAKPDPLVESVEMPLPSPTIVEPTPEPEPVADPFPATWGTAQPGDTVQHPEHGAVKVSTNRERDGMRRLLGKRTQDGVQVLLNERPDEAVMVLARTLSAADVAAEQV